eukprot:TRINITY_DN8993_c0_g1_i3.p1 TRINITY_DN8993_c0_g1~~TRINITY_DN8993_c0_g1_i3.p1  ORF type:complete len:425 (+),score=71.72 TRINITY_DN8993_c0_g1_i3:391-1665(+)
MSFLNLRSFFGQVCSRWTNCSQSHPTLNSKTLLTNVIQHYAERGYSPAPPSQNLGTFQLEIPSGKLIEKHPSFLAYFLTEHRVLQLIHPHVISHPWEGSISKALESDGTSYEIACLDGYNRRFLEASHNGSFRLIDIDTNAVICSISIDIGRPMIWGDYLMAIGSDDVSVWNMIENKLCWNGLIDAGWTNEYAMFGDKICVFSGPEVPRLSVRCMKTGRNFASVAPNYSRVTQMRADATKLFVYREQLTIYDISTLDILLELSISANIVSNTLTDRIYFLFWHDLVFLDFSNDWKQHRHIKCISFNMGQVSSHVIETAKIMDYIFSELGSETMTETFPGISQGSLIFVTHKVVDFYLTKSKPKDRLILHERALPQTQLEYQRKFGKPNKKEVSLYFKQVVFEDRICLVDLELEEWHNFAQVSKL